MGLFYTTQPTPFEALEARSTWFLSLWPNSWVVLLLFRIRVKTLHNHRLSLARPRQVSLSLSLSTQYKQVKISNRLFHNYLTTSKFHVSLSCFHFHGTTLLGLALLFLCFCFFFFLDNAIVVGKVWIFILVPSNFNCAIHVWTSLISRISRFINWAWLNSTIDT